MNNNTQLTQEYLESYYFEMFSKAGEAACRSIVRAAWKRLASRTRITAAEMDQYLSDQMKKKAVKYREIWDTEPREKIRYLVSKKAREYDYDYSNYFGY